MKEIDCLKDEEIEQLHKIKQGQPFDDKTIQGAFNNTIREIKFLYEMKK